MPFYSIFCNICFNQVIFSTMFFFTTCSIEMKRKSTIGFFVFSFAIKILLQDFHSFQCKKWFDQQTTINILSTFISCNPNNVVNNPKTFFANWIMFWTRKKEKKMETIFDEKQTSSKWNAIKNNWFRKERLIKNRIM